MKHSPNRRFFIFSNQYPAAMVDFMLDYLGSPAKKFFRPGFEIHIGIFYRYKLKTLCFPYSRKGKAAFLRFVFPGFLNNFRVEHYRICSVIIENNNAFSYSDHICRHSHTAFSVCGKSIKKILRGL